MKTLFKLLMFRLGYIQKNFVKKHLNFVIDDIRIEINKRPQYPNIGKLGCIKRIQKVIELMN